MFDIYFSPTEGPAWIDVITELLLSLMFKENLSSRIIAKQVMTFLTDHVTHSSVQLIVDVSKFLSVWKLPIIYKAVINLPQKHYIHSIIHFQGGNTNKKC